MNFKKSLLLVCLATVIPTIALADDLSDAVNALHTNYPVTKNIPSDQITKAGPLFTFMFSGQRVYTDKNANFLLVGGELLARDATSGATVNLTPKVYKPAPAVDNSNSTSTSNLTQFDPNNFTSVISKAPFKSTLPESQLSPQHPELVWKALPWDRGFTYVYGKGERKVFIMEDPDCPFCANMEQNMEKLGSSLNATVTILPMPLQIHTKENSQGFADTMKHGTALLCLANPAESWRDWMAFSAKNGVDATGNPVSPESNWKKWAVAKGLSPDASGTCARASEMTKNAEISKALFISGTPTLIFNNGAVQNGVPPDAQALGRMLDQAWDFVATHPNVQPFHK